MPSELMVAVRQTFSGALLVQGFGQTESTGMIAVTWPGEVYDFPLSTGRAISGCEIRIVDDNDDPVPADTVGEIVARGPQVMAGYWQNPAATRETLAAGMLHTGDLGYLDEGDRLYVVDRKKDMIIRGGQNVYSAEVEDALYQHPGVQEAAVVGQKDAIYGEIVVAFIRVREGHDLSQEALIEHMASRIASYKRPVKYLFVDEFPRTSNGKVRKVELRQQLQ
ncbi:class I adenylate-forming enzyme family protein [Sulfobacillus harzensis]|uniref:Long-chain fatty acid--CoA ligase n=1 Tax=Sulfobacillus harzensis TaxID=2729629 RepID=A0A7Y0Q436_9FIRM|nr:AMP-binding protein [Sulfobacillus harzensis]NMP23611.1 long-chain fatty acid--CoA ligase [Sulfobacillus harzensis]